MYLNVTRDSIEIETKQLETTLVELELKDKMRSQTHKKQSSLFIHYMFV
jgi:hypothetical protein